jgi:hypothetical protein
MCHEKNPLEECFEEETSENKRTSEAIAINQEPFQNKATQRCARLARASHGNCRP